MKNIVLCTLVMTMYLLVETHAKCEYNNKNLAVGVHYVNCNKVTCHSDGSVSALTCPLYQCAEGKEVGYRETDLSKPYPECCEGPVCAD